MENEHKLMIYIAGFLITYVITKIHIKRRVHSRGEDIRWGDIFARFIMSIAWPFTLLVFFIDWVCNTNVKPPKWL